MEGITQIKKRDGKIVPFTPDKITDAIYKAANAVAGKEGKTADRSISERISSRVIGSLEQMFGDSTVPTVEQVQDLVEKAIIKAGYADTAKAYILYRQQHKERRGLDEASKHIFDFSRRIIHGYVGGRLEEQGEFKFRADYIPGSECKTSWGFMADICIR